MNTHIILFLSIVLILVAQVRLDAQGVGINTSTPERILEVRGPGEQYIRLRSNAIGSQAGLELLRGQGVNTARDWAVINEDVLSFRTSTNDFTSSTAALQLDGQGNMAIGQIQPYTRLTILGDEAASDTEDGYILLGHKAVFNLVADANTILARHGGSPAPLLLQEDGGNTYISTSGQTIFAQSAGSLSIGGNYSNAKVNLEGDDFQLSLRNIEDGVNEWYIGASDNTWFVGDDQLIFSPSSSSGDAILRLMDISDNNGVHAPVMIHSSGDDQMLLLDGNEIDSREGPLYINHNSDQDTYFNVNGGAVYIGETENLLYHGKLHITTSNTALTLEQNSDYWQIAPMPNGNVNFLWGDFLVAYIWKDGGGDWMSVSDRRMKRNIRPVPRVMDKINDLGVYSYRMKGKTQRRDIGVIAQEAETLFPEVVHINEGQYGVAYGQLSVIAIKGIQEQQEELDSLRATADTLLARYD